MSIECYECQGGLHSSLWGPLRDTEPPTTTEAGARASPLLLFGIRAMERENGSPANSRER